MSAEAAPLVGSAGPTEVQDLDNQDQDNLAQWKTVLTQLEDNLDVFTGGTEVTDQARALALGWEPPSTLGPLPAELAARARMLTKAQDVAYGLLRGESRTNRHQAELIRSVPGPSAAAIYLDVTG